MKSDLQRTQLKFTVFNAAPVIQPNVWTCLAAPVQYVPTQGITQFSRTGNNIFCTSFSVNVQFYKSTAQSPLPAIGRLIIGLYKQQSNQGQLTAALMEQTLTAVLNPAVVGASVITQPWPANITNVQILKDQQFSFGTNFAARKHQSHHKIRQRHTFNTGLAGAIVSPTQGHMPFIGVIIINAQNDTLASVSSLKYYFQNM